MRGSARRLLLVCSGICVLALGAAVWIRWPQPSVINDENIGKVTVGMTRPQVEQILGGPARDESGGGEIVCTGSTIWTLMDLDRWVGPTHAIGIQFEGECVSQFYVGQVAHQETVFQMFRRWLRL